MHTGIVADAATCVACAQEVGDPANRRYRKPFALMARDLATIRRYCRLGAAEAELLAGPAAPIVLLPAGGPESVAPGIAPGQGTLGFLLPYSPLHRLLLEGWERPLAMTSGNRSEEPQCIDNADAKRRLAGIADDYLLHDREILNRVDDSVVRRMDGAPRLLRRARGYAPAPIRLPPGFAGTPPILALGGELKGAICLLQDGQAILSQHLGDLEEAHTAAEYGRTIDLYRALFRHDPSILAVDRHPDYRSSRHGRAWAAREGLGLVEVQHHFAHIAGVLADTGWPRDGARVVGVALDGLGYGDDGTVWGGEFLLADYCGYERIAHLAPVPLVGGAKAIREPWRSAYAHLIACFGWEGFRGRYPDLDLTHFLAGKPLGVLAAMVARRLNSPASSSCGRLFDAVAAALDICREAVAYEGQAASELEALAAPALPTCGAGYPFAMRTGGAGFILDPATMWSGLLDDLSAGVPAGTIAARFHAGLGQAVAELAGLLAARHRVGAVALSGGVFQNKTLLEQVGGRLRAAGLAVLANGQVPANDGGLALGQAVVAAARAAKGAGAV